MLRRAAVEGLSKNHEVLGKNYPKEALDILVQAGGREGQYKSVLRAAIKGLERMAMGPDKDLRAKVCVELQVLGETALDAEVQALAQQALSNLRAEKKAAIKSPGPSTVCFSRN